MAPYHGPVHPALLLPCESAGGPAGLATRGRGARLEAGRLDLLVFNALQSADGDDGAMGENPSPGDAGGAPGDASSPGSHVVRCVYSDARLRERLAHPQALITTLTANYRSHPTLLMLPSLLFYGGSLESRAPPALTRSCLGWSWLSRGSAALSGEKQLRISSAAPSDGFPLLCVGVIGSDSHLVDSPSFWNIAEVNAVCAAVQSLLSEAAEHRSKHPTSPLAALTPFDIGVISPYRQQVLRLRRALRWVARPSL